LTGRRKTAALSGPVLFQLLHFWHFYPLAVTVIVLRFLYIHLEFIELACTQAAHRKQTNRRTAQRPTNTTPSYNEVVWWKG